VGGQEGANGGGVPAGEAETDEAIGAG